VIEPGLIKYISGDNKYGLYHICVLLDQCLQS
jgi:hypothetical protein